MVDVKLIIKEDFVILDEETTLSEVVIQLQNFEKRAGLVFRKNKYLGLVEKRNLMKSSMDLSKVKVRGLLRKTPLLREDTDIQEAASLMFEADADYLPVERNKKIFGVVCAIDLAKLCLTLPEIKNLKVSEFKLIKPSKLSGDDNLGKALNIMQTEIIDHLPLFEKNKLSGMLSFRDVLRKYLNWSPNKDYSARFNAEARIKISDGELPKLASLPISNFSTNDNLVTVRSVDDVKKAVDKMLDNHVHDVLVVDSEQDYKGLLTVRNLLKKVSVVTPILSSNLQFVGLKDVKLKPYQMYNLQQMAQEFTTKLHRKLREEPSIVIHLKEHGKKDKGREKYSVTLHANLPRLKLSSEQVEWDPEMALRNAFEHIEAEALRRMGKQIARDKKS